MSKAIDELREHFNQRPVPNSKVIIEERSKVNAMIDAIETENDKASMERDLERLAQCVGQMDSGQRGKGVSFDEVPHIMSRLAVACMRLKLSGKLDELELDEDG